MRFEQLEQMWQELDFSDIGPDQYLVVFEDCGQARAYSDPPYSVVEKHDTLESARNRMTERASANLAIGILDSDGALLYCMDQRTEVFRGEPTWKPAWWQRDDLVPWVLGALAVIAVIWMILNRN